MVINQEWFNNNYQNNKEEKKIRIRDENGFQGSLTIKDYPSLEKLYLRGVKSIDKVILKNLTKLQELTVLDCDTNDLVIENCPQIKKINIENNFLTSLEFLANLESLEISELRADGNNFQGLAKKFWDLKKSREELKKEISKISNSNPEEKTRQIVLNLGKEFKEKEEKIKLLEIRVWELTKLSQEQRTKIQDYLNDFGSEKGLLMELIKTNLELKEATKKKIRDSVTKNREQFNQLRKELIDRLGEEKMVDIEFFLSDCEELINLEAEIGEKLDDNKSLLIEGKKEISSSQVPNSEEIVRRLDKRITEVEEQLKVRQAQPIIQSIIFNADQLAIADHVSFVTQSITIQYNDEILRKELTELKERYQSLELEPQSDPQKLKKTILFLGAKQIFAITRQATINNLIEKYKQIYKSDGKYEKVTVISESMSDTGEAVKDILPIAGVPIKLLGEGISVITNLLKNRSSSGYKQEFEDYLIEDEKAVSLLEETYSILNSSLQSKQSEINPSIIKMLNLNQKEFNQYDVFAVGRIKKGEKLTSEKMSQAIDLLTGNLSEFVDKSRRGAKDCAEEMEKLFKGKNGERLQTEVLLLLEKLTNKGNESDQMIIESISLEDQIQLKKDELEQLKNSVKRKLESKTSAILMMGGIRNGKWHLRLEELLEKQEKIVRGEVSLNEKLEEVKKQLKEKLAEKEIEKMCQVQKDLTKLQMELESSQEQQHSQIQISPKGNN